MQRIDLDYGDQNIGVDLPDDAVILRYGQQYSDPPEVDAVAATRAALKKPLGMPPLREVADPSKRAVIGFPDRVKGGSHDQAHRRVAIPLIVEELLAGGMPIENITLICAIGLHRMNTREDFEQYLGKAITDRFGPDRLLNHNAEADDLCDFGTDAMGNKVECSRLLAEADVPIIVGHCAGNPYGGFSGGYKMLVTGHTGWRCIASHHCPKSMHRKDWLGGSSTSDMRHRFRSIGQAIEAAIGKRVFAVDAVIGQGAKVLGVAAGGISEVEDATWPLATKRTVVTLDELNEPADVLVFGLPRDFHYGPGMGTHPTLASLAVGGHLSRCWHALKPGGVVIAAAQWDGWINDEWFPSYQPTYEAMLKHADVNAFLRSEEALAISTDKDYCRRYAEEFAYHPFHAMSMLSGGQVATKWAGDVFIVGAGRPDMVEAVGYTPVDTFADAMDRAASKLGTKPRILCTPESFSGGGPAPHLRLRSTTV